MLRFRILMLGALAVVGAVAPARAATMPIPHFDAYTPMQQGAYLTFLLQTTGEMLRSKGRAADADKTWALFQGKPGDPAKPAVAKFVGYLAAARNLNRQNAGDPTKHPLEVEHALALTFKEYGIEIPVADLIALSRKFWKDPPAATPPAKP